MQFLKMANLALRFGLELCLLAVWGWWGFRLGGTLVVQIVLAVLLVAAVAVVWGLFLSPRRTVRLPAGARLLMEVVLFALAVWALAAGGHLALAAALGAAYLLNKGLILVWKQG